MKQLRGSSVVECEPHKLTGAGSIPAPATISEGVKPVRPTAVPTARTYCYWCLVESGARSLPPGLQIESCPRHRDIPI